MVKLTKFKKGRLYSFRNTVADPILLKKDYATNVLIETSTKIKLLCLNTSYYFKEINYNKFIEFFCEGQVLYISHDWCTWNLKDYQ